MTNDYKPGIWVEILEDCREGHSATGMVGMYEADEVIDTEGDEFLEWLLEEIEEDELTVPRIRLTDGSVIYGFECFWKPTEEKN